MNWDKNKSIALSKVFIAFFALVLLAVDALGLFGGAASWSREFKDVVNPGQLTAIRVLVYGASVPAWTALWQLWALMGLLSAGEVFCARTVRRLRLISWCCFAVAVLSFVCAFFIHVSVLVVAAAAALMGLIVRIVKNVIEQGSAMRAELELTI